MYVKVAEKAGGTFEEAIKNAEGALAKNGWHVIASYDAAVPEGCGFKAHTIVINASDYARPFPSARRSRPRYFFTLTVPVVSQNDLRLSRSLLCNCA